MRHFRMVGWPRPPWRAAPRRGAQRRFEKISLPGVSSLEPDRGGTFDRFYRPKPHARKSEDDKCRARGGLASNIVALAHERSHRFARCGGIATSSENARRTKTREPK
jgi:hypothetical protein